MVASLETFQSPRIVVLGGTGFVGRSLAAVLTARMDRPPTFLVHRSRPDWIDAAGLWVRSVDLDDAGDVAAALKGHDVLINLLRPDGEGWYLDRIRNLAGHFAPSGVSRCVHASSIDVYAGNGQALINEQTRPIPQSSYEREHVGAEDLLRGSVPQPCIIRLGAVFGDGGKNVVAFANEMRNAPDWKLRLRRSLYGQRRMHLVSVETVAASLAECALRPLGTSVPATAIVTEDGSSDNNFAFVQDCLSEAFARPNLAGVPQLPPFVLKAILRARGLPPQAVHRRFSTKSMRDLGFDERHFRDRLKAYAKRLAEAPGWGEK